MASPARWRIRSTSRQATLLVVFRAKIVVNACHSDGIDDMVHVFIAQSSLECTPAEDVLASSGDSHVLRAPEAKINSQFESRAERYA